VTCLQVANATHDRQHADTMLEEYVTTTVTDVMSNFFGSQFSEQSTAVKVTVLSMCEREMSSFIRGHSFES